MYDRNFKDIRVHYLENKRKTQESTKKLTALEGFYKKQKDFRDA